jgi:hypothetical protein
MGLGHEINIFLKASKIKLILLYMRQWFLNFWSAKKRKINIKLLLAS